jgi:Tol biopolymer transport system component
MKTRFFHLIYCLWIFCLLGCSIDIAQPAVPASSSIASSIPTPVPDSSIVSPAASLSATTIPVTWASLNLTGTLIYADTPIIGEAGPINIQKLNLVTGEVNTLFTTTGNAWVFYLTISPNAEQLLMSYTPPSEGTSPESRALYILPMDGSMVPQPLFSPPTPDDHYIQAEWSPDGKYIYFAHYNSAQLEGQLFPSYDLFRMTYPDGKPEKIADHAFWPRLSADSSKLVFVSLDPVSGINELYVANVDGSDPRKITFARSSVPGIIDAPIFSPDGGFILFSAPPPPQAYQPNWLEKLMGIQIAKAHNVPSDWWSVPVDGGAPTRLTQLHTIKLFASIAPDGKHLASVSGEGIFVMNLDGSNVTQLLFNPGVSGTVSWIQ